MSNINSEKTESPKITEEFARWHQPETTTRERVAVVKTLRERGLSLEAIAEALQTSIPTVRWMDLFCAAPEAWRDLCRGEADDKIPGMMTVALLESARRHNQKAVEAFIETEIQTKGRVGLEAAQDFFKTLPKRPPGQIPVFMRETTPSASAASPVATQVSAAVLHNNSQLHRRSNDLGFSEETLNRLAEDIKKRGLQDPVIVRPHPTLVGEYEIIDGHRRVRALQRAGMTHVPVAVVAESAYDEDARALYEKYHAVGTTIEDKSNLFTELRQRGKTFQEIAHTFGVSLAEVGRLGMYLNAPSEIRRNHLGRPDDRIPSLRTVITLIAAWKLNPEDTRRFIADEILKRGVVTQPHADRFRQKLSRPSKKRRKSTVKSLPATDNATETKTSVAPVSSTVSETTSGLSSMQTLDVARIHESRVLPRRQNHVAYSSSSLQYLADDIRANGLKCPLLVKPYPSVAGDYEVISGNRRLRALKLAGIMTAEVIVRQSERHDGLPSAFKRADATLTDKLNIVRRLRAEGMRNRDIGDLLGIDHVTVAKYLKLGELPEKLSRLCSGQDPQVSAAAVLTLYRAAQLYPEKTDAFINETLEQKGQITVKEAEAFLASLETLVAVEKEAQLPELVQIVRNLRDHGLSTEDISQHLSVPRSKICLIFSLLAAPEEILDLCRNRTAFPVAAGVLALAFQKNAEKTRAFIASELATRKSVTYPRAVKFNTELLAAAASENQKVDIVPLIRSFNEPDRSFEEKAQIVRRLLQLGLAGESVAQRLSIKPGQVFVMSAFAAAPEELRQLYRAGRIKTPRLVVELASAMKRDPEAVRLLIKKSQRKKDALSFDAIRTFKKRLAKRIQKNAKAALRLITPADKKAAVAVFEPAHRPVARLPEWPKEDVELVRQWAGKGKTTAEIAVHTRLSPLYIQNIRQILEVPQALKDKLWPDDQTPAVGLQTALQLVRAWAKDAEKTRQFIDETLAEKSSIFRKEALAFNRSLGKMSGKVRRSNSLRLARYSTASLKDLEVVRPLFTAGMSRPHIQKELSLSRTRAVMLCRFLSAPDFLQALFTAQPPKAGIRTINALFSAWEKAPDEVKTFVEKACRTAGDIDRGKAIAFCATLKAPPSAKPAKKTSPENPSPQRYDVRRSHASDIGLDDVRTVQQLSSEGVSTAEITVRTHLSLSRVEDILKFLQVSPSLQALFFSKPEAPIAGVRTVVVLAQAWAKNPEKTQEFIDNERDQVSYIGWNNARAFNKSLGASARPKSRPKSLQQPAYDQVAKEIRALFQHQGTGDLTPETLAEKLKILPSRANLLCRLKEAPQAFKDLCFSESQPPSFGLQTLSRLLTAWYKNPEKTKAFILENAHITTPQAQAFSVSLGKPVRRRAEKIERQTMFGMRTKTQALLGKMMAVRRRQNEGLSIAVIARQLKYPVTQIQQIVRYFEAPEFLRNLALDHPLHPTATLATVNLLARAHEKRPKRTRLFVKNFVESGERISAPQAAKFLNSIRPTDTNVSVHPIPAWINARVEGKTKVAPERRFVSHWQPPHEAGPIFTVSVNSLHEPVGAAPQQRMGYGQRAIDRLAADIKERGQQTPLVVKPLPNLTGHYVILSGYRRWYAMKRLGLTTAEAVVVSVPVCDEHRALFHRFRDKSVPLSEKLALLQQVRDWGWSSRDIRCFFKIGVEKQENYFAFLSAPQYLQDLSLYPQDATPLSLPVVVWLIRAHRINPTQTRLWVETNQCRLEQITSKETQHFFEKVKSSVAALETPAKEPYWIVLVNGREGVFFPAKADPESDTVTVEFELGQVERVPLPLTIVRMEST